ncbi:MAG: hypothetical protein FJW66_07360 [Actinobacteria bacterium]|nr:hypothetical protein [Actinomycetota bacterium]
MTGEERILKTIRKEKVDRIPICFHFSDEKTERMFAEKLSMDIEEFRKITDSDIKRCYLMDDLQMNINNPEFVKYALEKGFAKKGDEDNVLYDRWGVGWVNDGSSQKFTSNPYKNIESLQDFQPPEVAQEGQFYMVERFIKEYKQNGYAVIIPQFYTIFEKSWLMLGYENFFIQCYENRKLIEILMDKITDYRVKLAEMIAGFNVTCGHSGDDFGTQRGPVMSLQIWRELFKPRLKRIWDVYTSMGIPVIHHSCGDCRIYLPDMIEMGLKVLNPVQASAMPIAELKRDFGDKLTFYGGIDCQDILTKGTPADIRKNVNETVSILGKNGGLILSPINIMNNVSVDNLKALIESINEYR